jgi:hypothetical protein
MRPGLYRHHLISFVGVLVVHFPFAPTAIAECVVVVLP